MVGLKDFRGLSQRKWFCKILCESPDVVILIFVPRTSINQVVLLFAGFVHNLFWACCSSIIVNIFTFKNFNKGKDDYGKGTQFSSSPTAFYR